MSTPGKFLGIKVNGIFVSCETSCTINFDVDMLPASAQDSGGWKEFIAGIRSWSITVDMNTLLESVPVDIKGLINTGLIKRRLMFVEFSTRPSVNIQISLSGAVLLASGSITAPTKGYSTSAVTLQGTGPLKTSYHDLALLINAMPSIADYPIVVQPPTT